MIHPPSRRNKTVATLQHTLSALKIAMIELGQDYS
jgi:hypothetical protein